MTFTFIITFLKHLHNSLVTMLIQRILRGAGLLLIIVQSSCTHKTDEHALFELMPNTGINFVNKVQDQEYNNSFLFRNFL